MARVMASRNSSLVGSGCVDLGASAPSGLELVRSFTAPEMVWTEDGATCGSIQNAANRLAELSQKWQAIPVDCGNPCFGCTAGETCCSSRGRCERGVCVCRGGAHGIDCSESPRRNKLSNLSAHPRPAGFRIYVYDLPGEFSIRPYALRSCRRADTSMYSAEERFLRLLLADKRVRTTNPNEADLFYVPTFTTSGPAGNVGCDRARLLLVQKYIATRYTFWARCEGCDHVFFMTNDRGACGLGPAGKNSIILSHWGLLGPYAPTMTEYDKIGRQYLDTLQLLAGINSARWCHSPHKDIVVPPFYAGIGQVQGSADSSPRKFLLTFAGGIWGYNNRPHRGKKNLSYYSLGMRQALFMRYSQTADQRIRMIDHAVPDSIFSLSEFCLAPAGGGFGIRLMKAIALNCVPLISQPYVLQPFEDLLRYEDFSVRVGHNDVADLSDHLQQLQPLTARMRRRLYDAHRAFSWEQGGLAYNYTVFTLCLRAKELKYGTAAHAECTQLAAALPSQGKARLRRFPSWFPPQLKSTIHSSIAMRSSRYRSAA